LYKINATAAGCRPARSTRSFKNDTRSRQELSLAGSVCIEKRHAFSGMAGMKFIEWIESVDPHAVPIAVDAGLSLFSAGLMVALLKMLFEFAA
jgi:hypothetical protein